MTEETSRRCSALRGNSVIGTTFPARPRFLYQYFNMHRESVRGTMDWIVGGILTDWYDDLQLHADKNGGTTRSTESQFFRAYERHDLCLSGKPNAMGGGRAFCDAGLAEDLRNVCQAIYTRGEGIWGRKLCQTRAVLVIGAVAGIGGDLDKPKEIEKPYDQINAACTNYRGWTPPSDYAVKAITSRHAEDGTAGSYQIIRLSARNSEKGGEIVLQMQEPGGLPVTATIPLSPDFPVCATPHKSSHTGLSPRSVTIVDCESAANTMTVAALKLRASDFLMYSPIASDFDGDGRDELLLVAPVGLANDPQGEVLLDDRPVIAMVGLPVSLDGEQPKAKALFFLANFGTDIAQCGPDAKSDCDYEKAKARAILMSLMAERPSTGSFLVTGNARIRPQQVAFTGYVILKPSKQALSVDPIANATTTAQKEGNSNEDLYYLMLRTVGFRKSNGTFEAATVTRTNIFRDGRVDPDAAPGSKNRQHIEMYKRLFYPQDVIAGAAGKGDAIAYYFMNSGHKYHRENVSQYMERVAVQPVQVDNVFDPNLPHIFTEGELDKGQGLTLTSSYTHWGKLMYPAVRGTGSRLRFAPFLTNCNVLDEIRTARNCPNRDKEIIRLAVVDEAAVSQPRPVSTGEETHEYFDGNPKQIQLVDIGNKRWLPRHGKDCNGEAKRSGLCQWPAKTRSCPVVAIEMAACQWFDLPSYVGRFGREGETGMIFLRQLPGFAPGTGKLNAPQSIKALIVYQDGKNERWSSTEYQCSDMPLVSAFSDGAVLSPFWLTNANAMVAPSPLSSAGTKDMLVFPLTAKSASPKSDAVAQASQSWKWAEIHFDATGPVIVRGDAVVEVHCGLASVQDSQDWDVKVRVKTDETNHYGLLPATQAAN